MKKMDPYRVRVKVGEIVRMIPARNKVEAREIVKHAQEEHGTKARIFKWNSDDQRYLRTDD
jgi:hypothetical protein